MSTRSRDEDSLDEHSLDEQSLDEHSLDEHPPSNLATEFANELISQLFAIGLC